MAQQSDKDNCGACAGLEQQTPVHVNNPPAQPAVDYRIGSHSKFKSSMLSALTSAERPAMQPLGTRDDDDFTIAYLDGVATVLDVLSFYQERYMNENFLRTSTERRSVLEMAQLIGYQLNPGVAAATHLAFTLQATPASLSSDPLANAAITIPVGTRVQSVPGQDETPQIFETTDAIKAKAAWNAVAAQTRFPYVPSHGDRDIYIDGVSSNVEPGDVILIVGQARMNNEGSERWDVRLIKQVEKDNSQSRTRLVWDQPLGHVSPTIQPSDKNVQVFVFRKRTSLFGHNAPDYRFMSRTLADDPASDSMIRRNTGEGEFAIASFTSTTATEWPGFYIQNNQIDLASPEDKVVVGSWVALVSNEVEIGSNDLPGYVELYRVAKVSALSRSDYGISGKITRIEPDTFENLDQFSNRLRETLVLADSEELTVQQRPLLYPVFQNVLYLESHVDELVPAQYFAITGKRQRVKVAPGITDLDFEMEAANGQLNEGDSLEIVAIPEKYSGLDTVQLSPSEFGELINSRDASTLLKLQLIDRDGSTGTVVANAATWLWDSAEDDSELSEIEISEIAQIGSGDSAIIDDRDRTVITLSASLKNVYQRDSVRVNFNVAPANHGETIMEILGNGDARKSDQSFALKHVPLTHVSADTPSGATPALAVRVNELLWNETSSLYQANGDARSYQIRIRDDDTTSIQFGDGIEGARLPTGQTNVRATYRKSLGIAGNLDSGQLMTLLQKPLGVTEVTNPDPSTGGADPEVIEDARQNAPLTVLTLDRAVSELDYQHYARAFSGIAKAHALWINAGSSRGIYITLAGINGAEIPTTSATYENLMNSLRHYGDPMLPLTLVNYQPVTFALGMAVKVHAAAERSMVLAALESTLRDYFSFAKRDFGQHISQDEVLTVAHSVDHIEAVRITRFYKQEPGAVDSVVPIIASQLPVAALTISPSPAQLLTLSAEPLEIGDFS